jgi:hypothetical protein
LIIVSRNGKDVVITGWRAWLAGLIVSLVVAVVLIVVAFLILGLTITIAATMLFVIPVAVVLALLAGIWRFLEGPADPLRLSAPWRRGWDSNPRDGFPPTRFPSVRLQPLGHPSFEQRCRAKAAHYNRRASSRNN